MSPISNPCGHRDPSTRKRDCDLPRWNRHGLCQTHQMEWQDARRVAGPRVRAARRAPKFDNLLASVVADADTVTDADVANSHEYVPMKDLVELWHAVVTGAKTRPAGNLMFVGPSGSGKTDGARYLSALVGLPMTKVDAASMTDPEAWFGTREITVSEGVAVTSYRPSSFVDALQKPGVVLIDEVNRVRDEHRNVLLPLLDATRSVTNPLTGETIVRHPQCFIIMAGNVGLRFTGTSAIDPAFMTRALTIEFDYIDSTSEARIVHEASGCDEDSARVFVRFATETRAKANIDSEFTPISTRECIEAGRLVASGLSRDLAVKFVVLNAASSEGGTSSIRQELQNLWNGVRITKAPPVAGADTRWLCSVHGAAKDVPAGVSMRTGKAYNAFRACPVYGCHNTSDHVAASAQIGTVIPSAPVVPSAPAGATTCKKCYAIQPAGRATYCFSCGGTLS